MDPVAHFKQGPEDTAEKGCILISVGPATEQADLIHYNVMLRKLPNGTITSVGFTKMMKIEKLSEAIFEEDGKRGVVYHFCVPSGKYELFRYRVYRPHAVSPDFSETFEVQAHRTVYLGRFWVGLDLSGPAPKAAGKRVDRRQQDLELSARHFREQLARDPILE